MASEYSDAAVEAHYLDAYQAEYGYDYFDPGAPDPDQDDPEWDGWVKESERW